MLYLWAPGPDERTGTRLGTRPGSMGDKAKTKQKENKVDILLTDTFLNPICLRYKTLVSARWGNSYEIYLHSFNTSNII